MAKRSCGDHVKPCEQQQYATAAFIWPRSFVWQRSGNRLGSIFAFLRFFEKKTAMVVVSGYYNVEIACRCRESDDRDESDTATDLPGGRRKLVALAGLGAGHEVQGRLRRVGVSNTALSAWSDGSRGLPVGIDERSRRRGCVPGDVPDPCSKRRFDS